MKHSDFHIGLEFWDNGALTPQKCRCTDVGTRVIVAIKLEHNDDPSWYNGPPYAVLEVVFDEYDMEACDLELDASCDSAIASQPEKHAPKPPTMLTPKEIRLLRQNKKLNNQLMQLLLDNDEKPSTPKKK